MNHLLSQISQLLAYDPASPMLFNTGMFMVLFVIFMFLYLLVRGYRVVKMLLVIAFSLYFYYKSGSWCVYILCGVCVSDYVLGLLLGWFKRDILRRAVVALNVLVNVGMLVYFKYFNLLYEAFCSIVSTSFEPLDVILPAGISFFTFRSISYIVDVYRGDMKPCRNFLDYFFSSPFSASACRPGCASPRYARPDSRKSFGYARDDIRRSLSHYDRPCEKGDDCRLYKHKLC